MINEPDHRAPLDRDRDNKRKEYKYPSHSSGMRTNDRAARDVTEGTLK